jgi:serine/threonine protein kinase
MHISYIQVCFNSKYNNELLFYRRIMGKRPEIPNYVSHDLGDIITKLLDKDAHRRLKIKEIKAHPFFKISSFPYVIRGLFGK